MYLLNSFSLQMLADLPAAIAVEEISEAEFLDLRDGVRVCDDCGTVLRSHRGAFDCGCRMVATVTDLPGCLVSAVGHADTARILGVPMNRINIQLMPGQTAIVAQLQGGRLPEGATTLPEGFSFKFFRVLVK